MTFVLYQIVNLYTGKSYIGITRYSAAQRFDNHWSVRGKRTFYLPLAMRKYARIWWSVVTLAEVGSWDEACALEREEIASRRTNDRRFGYNMTAGGDGTWGCVTPRKTPFWSEAAREKLRQSRLGKKASPETLRRFRLARTGIRKNPEQIERSAKFHRGRKRTEASKLQMAASRSKWWVLARAQNRVPKTTANPARDVEISLSHWETRSKKETGRQFGISESAVHAALRRVAARFIEGLKAASPMYDHLTLARGTTLIHPTWVDLAA